MKPTTLSRIKQVTEALYLDEYDRMRPVLQEEARLRGQLARLDAQMAQARHDGEHTPGFKPLGADILWQGWESRTRRALNTDLARVQAQKLTAMDRLRAAFGRKEALARLTEAAGSEAARKRRAAESAALCQDAVLKHASRGK
ncbi:MAG: hypothetical protein AB3N21_07810 [Ruegeria sp.]|uniref:hypothetical protein n=1 Tax=Ruegeria sp. TaxID=1879320 RepID=UPI00349E4B78